MSERTTVAFIGLGIMGAPMAANLLAAGFDVVGHNRSPEKTERFAANGGRGAATLADAVRDADVVATMVPDSPDVRAVLTGDDGVFAHARDGALVIDFSTIRPDVAADLAADGVRRGLRVLDAPVSGAEKGAVDGALSIMVGGAAEHFEAALKVLGGGLAGSTVLERKGAAMLAREFTPGFRIELHDKDMGIVTAAAREAGVVIPLGSAVAQLIAALKAQGDGGLDHSALLKLVTRLSGRDDG